MQSLFSLPTAELSHILAILEEEKQKKISLVQQLYVALSCGDRGRFQGNLASEVDWWFHGPPCCQYLMHTLTGIAHDSSSFHFLPRSITVLGNKVVVEGWEGESCYWIHVWTVDNGIITQVREYFNTSLVVKEFKVKPTSSLFGKTNHLCTPLWQSKLSNPNSMSMPGIVLAI